MSFIAGFADAEGSIYFHKKQYSSSFELHISNTNVELLKRIQGLLAASNYHPGLYRHTRMWLSPNGPIESEIWNLSVYRREEVKRLLMELPLRHKEKVTKARLALSFLNMESVLDSGGTP